MPIDHTVTVDEVLPACSMAICGASEKRAGVLYHKELKVDVGLEGTTFWVRTKGADGWRLHPAESLLHAVQVYNDIEHY